MREGGLSSSASTRNQQVGVAGREKQTGIRVRVRDDFVQTARSWSWSWYDIRSGVQALRQCYVCKALLRSVWI